MKVNALFITGLTTLLIACATAVDAPTQFSDGTQITMKRTDVISFMPVPKKQRTVYLEVNDNTDIAFTITQPLAEQIERHHYQLVNTIEQAHFLVQVNIQRIGNITTSHLATLKTSHFGNSLNELTLTNETDTESHTNYTMIADIKVFERMSPTPLDHQKIANTDNMSHWINGNSIDWERFYTRVIISAQNTTLPFDAVQNDMQQATAISIGGIFA
jgi:hypothetical protein